MERLVYIVIPQQQHLACVIRTTRLMKWEAFSEAVYTDPRELLQKRFASYLRDEDRPILMSLMQLTNPGASEAVLHGDYGHDVFQRLVATRRLFVEGGNRIRLQAGEPVEGRLDWTEAPDQKWRPIVRTPAGCAAYAMDPPVYIQADANTCGRLQLDQPPGLAYRWLSAKAMTEPQVATFCLGLAKSYPAASFPTPGGVNLKEDQPAALRTRLTIETRAVLSAAEQRAQWTNLRDRLRLRVTFCYGEGHIDWDAPEPTVSFRREGAIVRVRRDREREAAALDQLRAWGFVSDQADVPDGFFNFDSALFRLPEPASWRHLVGQVWPALDSGQWEWRCDRKLHLAVATDENLPTQVHGGRDHTSYHFECDVVIDERRNALLPLLQRALRAQKHRSPAEMTQWLQNGDFAVRLPAPADEDPTAPAPTTWVALPPGPLVRLTEHLHELFDAQNLRSGAGATLNRWRVGELLNHGLVTASADLATGSDPAEPSLTDVATLCRRMAGGIAVQPRVAPTNLRADLRPYQQSGLGWLHTLAEIGASGILADDMGLGKTVQTLAHLLELKAAGRLDQGTLLVAPTSVIDNWEQECARFAPTLRVGRFHGAQRESNWEQVRQQDVVITTYALVWRDVGLLARKPWSLIVLDEAQYIKNPESRTTRAVCSLSAHRRLCLTGTPIENHLRDIWSLFEFLLPGFLGDRETFNQRIAQPTASPLRDDGAPDDDARRDDADDAFARILRDRLRQRLAPFVLRRRKEDVLPDLPPKTEIVHAVPMTVAQRHCYESARDEARQQVRNLARKGEVRTAKVQILSLLLRLRQICCDPRLWDDAPGGPFAEDDSAKLEALLELVEELRAKDSRILIFSQFTSMLELIGRALNEAGHAHLELTGRTPNRGELVQRFQAGECPIFLISLRAGGAGLNLTAADSVIHFDPWWNPAVERQATDRSHRLGQEKPVFVYKLVVDDSIESRIQVLQRSKLALVEGLLTEGDIDRLELDEQTLDFLLED